RRALSPSTTLFRSDLTLRASRRYGHAKPIRSHLKGLTVNERALRPALAFDLDLVGRSAEHARDPRSVPARGERRTHDQRIVVRADTEDVLGQSHISPRGRPGEPGVAGATEVV